MKIRIYEYLNNTYKVINQQIRPLSGTGSNSANLDVITTILPAVQSGIPEALQVVPTEIIGFINEWKSEAGNRSLSPAHLAAMLETPYKELTPKDRLIFRPFRWFVKDGLQNIVVETGPKTYIMTNPTTNLLPNLVEHDRAYKVTKAKYIETIRQAYNEGEPTGLLTWDLATRQTDTGWIYPKFTLGEYFNESKDYFLTDDAYRIDEPVNITKDKDQAAYLHVNVGEQTGECPLIENWLNLRFTPDDANVFRSYICSIFDPDNQSRQALWLSDNGQTGKTTILNAISEALGNNAVATVSTNDLKSNFIGSIIYGKRLIVVGDNKNPNLIQTGVIHNILGGDMMNVEFKGMTAFSTVMHSRMLIASNILPDIDTSAAHEKSRVLILQLKDNRELTKEQISSYQLGGNEIQLTSRIAAEIPSFVSKYWDMYMEMCPTHGNLTLSEAADVEMYDKITTEEIIGFEHIMDKYVALDESKYMSRILLQNLFKVTFTGSSTGNNFAFANFKKRLTQVYGISEVRVSAAIDPNRPRVWKGIGINIENLMNISKIMDAPVIGDWLREQEEGDNTYV